MRSARVVNPPQVAPAPPPSAPPIASSDQRAPPSGALVEGQIERLKAAYGLTGNGAQKALATALGEKASTVASWVMRESIPLRAFELAKEQTGKSLDWLIQGIEPSSQVAISSKLQNASTELKFSSSLHENTPQAALGGWSLVVDVGRSKVVYTLVPKLHASLGEVTYGEEGPVGEFAFQSAWMERNFGRSGAGFCLVDVFGDAMVPTFMPGDTVLVDRNRLDLDRGGIFVVRHGNELLVRRVRRQLSGSLQISADSPAVLPEVMPAELASNIVGRVVWPRS